MTEICTFSECDAEGKPRMCDQPAWTAMPLMDSEGRPYPASTTRCFTHFLWLLRLQEQAKSAALAHARRLAR